MVGIDVFKRGIASYADREIISRMPTGSLKRILAGAAIALALDKALDRYLRGDVAQAIGVCDGDQIDVDALADAIKSQINQDGMRINVAGIEMIFRASDIDAIRSEIEASA